MTVLSNYLNDKQIVVCCGAGGVGKTTVSAALALAAARRGRRVLVLTIDPSRRLAETLGIVRNHPEPLPLSPENLAAGGVEEPGELHAWVLDPGLVADRVVRSLAKTREEAQRLLTNRIYLALTRMVAGMQEYTAVEALHDLVGTGLYDLIILDTPPSRNALSFLDAPVRLGRFLDGRIFKMFLPREDGMVRGTARRLIWKVLSAVLGEQAHAEFSTFLSSFAAIFKVLSGSAKDMKARLQRPEVTFLLVTSAAQEAVRDAFHFRNRLRSLDLQSGGFVLNRSIVAGGFTPLPDEFVLAVQIAPELAGAAEDFLAMAQIEQTVAETEEMMLTRLTEEAGPTAASAALPEIAGGVEDMKGLSELVDWMEANAFGAQPARD